MTLKNVLLILALVLSYNNFYAQNADLSPCGTEMGVSDWLRDFQSRIDGVERNDDILYLPLQVHIVGTDEGTGYMSLRTTLLSFCTLNRDFEDSNIQFFLAGPFNYIDNSDWFDHSFSQGFQMMSQNNFSGVINCYVVDSPAGNCGYFSPGVDGIALAKNCIQPDDHTWAHEVGHYLSLPHPFSGLEGEEFDYSEPLPSSVNGRPVERLDGSNCSFAGDGFCDTKADYLNFRWSCNNQEISGVEQIDPTGAAFQSDGTLIMSYSNSSCKYRFSEDQTAAMRANVEEERSYLITTPPADGSIEITNPGELTVISPLEDEINSSTVRLEWEGFENADRYLLQISRLPSFPAAITTQVITSNTFYDFSDMEADKTYSWRVKPYNDYDTCIDFFPRETFSTGDGVVNTNELLPSESVSLLPNPVSTNQPATLVISSAETAAASWNIRNAQGQLVAQQQFQATAGEQRLTLPTSVLSAGIYFVEVKLNDRRSVQKLVVY